MQLATTIRYILEPNQILFKRSPQKTVSCNMYLASAGTNREICDGQETPRLDPSTFSLISYQTRTLSSCAIAHFSDTFYVGDKAGFRQYTTIPHLLPPPPKFPLPHESEAPCTPPRRVHANTPTKFKNIQVTGAGTPNLRRDT